MKNLRIILATLIAAVSCAAADTSITALPAISAVTSTTVLPVVDTSGTPTTKKATAAQLIAGLPAATGAADGKMVAADKAKLDAATDAATNSAIVRRDSSGNFSANIITAAQVTGLASPTLGSDAANKTYVDAAAAGLVIKGPAVAATIGANITLSGGAPNTLDGITLVANNRILVKDQTDNKQNGIYFVATLGTGSNGTWTRTTDTDTGAELVTGSYCFIAGGTINANAAYTMTTTGTIVIGTSPIVWNLFSQVTQIQAANILGQIVAAQIQDSAINTAKFAAGITPVELLGTLPTSGNFAGRTVFLTTDAKLYRYNGSAFIATIPASDLSTQIAAGQISANAVTAGTIATNAVTAGTVAAGAITATELAAASVTTSKLFAGAVDTAALAANSVTAAKILAGTITADKLTVSSLSAISANVGTLTSGTAGGWTLASTKFSASSGAASVDLDASNAWLRTARGTNTMTIGTRDPGTGAESYADFVFGIIKNVGIKSWFYGGEITIGDGSSGSTRVLTNASGITLKNSSNVTKLTADSTTGAISTVGNISTTGGDISAAANISAGSDISLSGYLKKVTNTGWTPPLWDGDNSIEFQWSGGLKVRIDGSTVLNITTTP